MMKKLLMVLATIAISLSAMAEVPSLINYQGRLKSKFGSWINDTPNFTLKVFDQSTGGNLLYEEEIGQVSVVDGAYSFNFGANGISNIPTSELIATADGEKQIFNYTTRFKPIVGNVKISGGGYSWTDDGSSSPSKFTATINKTTGSVSAIYITKAPKVGTEITIEYNKRGITEALSKSGQTWLELTVGEETLSPRERLVAVPFALNSKYAEKLKNPIQHTIFRSNRRLGPTPGEEGVYVIDGTSDFKLVLNRAVYVPVNTKSIKCFMYFSRDSNAVAGIDLISTQENIPFELILRLDDRKLKKIKASEFSATDIKSGWNVFTISGKKITNKFTTDFNTPGVKLLISAIEVIGVF
jgi:hypothetical protein